MPIVRMTSWDRRNQLPAGATNFKVAVEAGRVEQKCDHKTGEWYNVATYQGPFIPYCTYDILTGFCLYERENNGYHDSDFFMTYWDEETQSPKTVEFATTRGWSYPCYASHPDATPEVRAKFQAWERKQEEMRRKRMRHERAVKLQEFRKEISKVAEEFNVPYIKLLKLRRKTDLPAILALFGSRIRSKFKLSLRNQVVKWLLDTSSTYEVPLSKKQMGYISDRGY